MFRSSAKTRLTIFTNGEITHKHSTLHIFWCNKAICEARSRSKQELCYFRSGEIKVQRWKKKYSFKQVGLLSKHITTEISETSDLSLSRLY